MRRGTFLWAAAWLVACGGDEPARPGSGGGGGGSGGGGAGGAPGSFELVDLEDAPKETPYNLVRVRGTHNSYSPKEHGASIGEQLAGGVRMLELDLRLVVEKTHASIKQDGGSDPAVAANGEGALVLFERSGEIFAWQGERAVGGGVDWRAKTTVGAGTRPAVAYSGADAAVAVVERGGKVEATRASAEGGSWLAFSGAFEEIGSGARPALAVNGDRAALVVEQDGELVLRLGELGGAGAGGIAWCAPVSLGPGSAPAVAIDGPRIAVAYASADASAAEIRLVRGTLGSGCASPSFEGTGLGAGADPAVAFGPAGVVVVASSAGALATFREKAPGGALEAASPPPEPSGVSPALAATPGGLLLVHAGPDAPRLFTWEDAGKGWEGRPGERVRVAHDGAYDKDPEIGYERGLEGDPVFGPAYLEDYARQIRAFHEAEPDHAPVALLLDVKEPELLPKLDEIVSGLELAIAEGSAIPPAEIQGSHPSMREAIAAGWPSVGALSGRFFLVLSGVASRESHPRAWKEVTRFPDCLAEGEPSCADTALFARAAATQPDEAVLDLLRRGHVVRYWSVLEEPQIAEARRIGVQWIAEDGFGR